MEFNVVNSNHMPEILLGTDESNIYLNEDIHTHHHEEHAGGNIWHDDDDEERPSIDDVANDIEIIAIDPNQEYTSDEEGQSDDDYMSVFEEDTAEESSSLITIENVKAALQASGHSRVSRQSMSVPHSPMRYSMDFSGISFDDLDIHSHFPDLLMHNSRPLPLVDTYDAVKTFDLASYITQDDNFEVISPSKILPNRHPFVQEVNFVNNSLNTTPVKAAEMRFVSPAKPQNAEIAQQQTELPTQMASRKRRACVLSSKRMHYQVPSSSEDDDEDANELESGSGDNNHEESSGDNAVVGTFPNDNFVEIERIDNTKVDPTWMPCSGKEQKSSKTTKSQKVKEPKIKKHKSAPTPLTVKSSSKSSQATSSKSVSQQTKNLFKVCKSTTSRMLNASQLPKEKIHKITKPPVGKTISLDHDYCSAKSQKSEMFRKVSNRKAIEIPIIDATIDKKLSRKKEEKSAKKHPVEVASMGTQKSSTEEAKAPTTTNPAAVSVKRKLNLAEYMQRKESRQAVEPEKEVENPILAAKRKVLRKQELLKEAKMKDMEPKIDNVPLLPILPLAEITGYAETEPEPIRVLLNPDYEEIVIVSMGVNTEISIPPAADDEKSLLAYVNDTIKKVKGSNVVEFSNSLISSIQDVVLKKGNASLPADIGSDSVQTPGMSPGKPEMANVPSCDDDENTKESEHGEDKVIMHLRKNRPRPETRSTSMQTLEVPSFVPLRRLSPLPRQQQAAAVTTHRSRRSKSRGERRSSRSRSKHYYRRSASRHSSSRNIDGFEQFRRSRSRQRTLSRNSESSTCSSGSSSSSSSSSTNSSCDGTFKRDVSPYRPSRNHLYYNSASSRRSSSSYSSRSRSRESIRYRAVSRGHEQNRSMRKHEDPEKRNIVYVGQLEPELTKEQLRKKFISYGHVTNVSIHMKDNGMRYGFITFEKPQEAYRAIDTSKNDPLMSKYDVSFGGRRAFCGSHYADLDGINSYINYHQISYPIEPYESTVKKHEEAESFEDMLKKLKASINAKKPTTS
ncbi:uncharacterized protein LOC134834435 [Culicoides brevitarsis]|uniref:uncharacterized protein LOC134834435 n=1 Tax=Culicoides brevitarsis TaxID=469753 RepID=UPI00307B2989